MNKKVLTKHMIKNKYIRFLFPLIFLILPIIGMFISDEVNWNIFDFILMGFLLISLEFTLNYVLAKKITGKIVYVLLILFVFIHSNLGRIGSWNI